MDTGIFRDTFYKLVECKEHMKQPSVGSELEDLQQIIRIMIEILEDVGYNIEPDEHLDNLFNR